MPADVSPTGLPVGHRRAATNGSLSPDAPVVAGARGFRGPFARWPRVADAVLAVVALLATVFLVEGPGDSLHWRALGAVSPLVLVVFVAANAALYWRRRAPLPVLGLLLVAWIPLVVVDDAYVGAATLVALYSVGRYAPDSYWGPAGVAAAIAAVNIDGLDHPGRCWEEAIFGTVALTGAWYVGRRLQLREERAAQVLRERAAEARRIMAEERTRIARELHDVVAHRVSLMTVQAGAAKAVAAQDLTAAVQAMGAVEEAGREALDELRHLLGVLRPDSDSAWLGPQPGLADLPRLVEQISAAGVPVAFAARDLPEGLPDRVDLFAYRIVQEALTNVLKHAGPGTRAEVGLSRDRTGLTLEILDDGAASETRVPAGGHGIVGMRERALLLGGSLDAGPRAGGGFRVVAHLPLEGGRP
ncbi:sensor histidine kinase [Nocardia crassostreae]|uniref:sensor histidine kinase n=1 Tax=Nocardia crassostreae TaxID=53428 RepID=UPI001C3F7ADD|nr:sensor histidine kinase [Nocardia crassostreae]